MSQLLIQHYLNDLADLRRVSGEARESIVSEAFKTLLKDWGRTKDLILIPQYKIDTADRRYVDGALVYSGLRLPFGYWEAKDEKDNLDDEIETKFRRSYPQDNIVFEDSREAVLFQNKKLVMRCRVDDADALEKLLNHFFAYERDEIADFNKAVTKFKTDLPAVLEALRAMIDKEARLRLAPARQASPPARGRSMRTARCRCARSRRSPASASAPSINTPPSTPGSRATAGRRSAAGALRPRSPR